MGRGVQSKKTFCRGGMDIFWNCTLRNETCSILTSMKQLKIIVGSTYSPEYTMNIILQYFLFT